ncbi:hypothetical protein ACE5IS_19850 [Leptospira wolffii]|uniref:Uncharacterized protein n=1 Tax=Leptospira wolffii TaxID=409998 RepID=A0ABV5BRD4_9LEPT
MKIKQILKFHCILAALIFSFESYAIDFFEVKNCRNKPSNIGVLAKFREGVRSIDFKKVRIFFAEDVYFNNMIDSHEGVYYWKDTGLKVANGRKEFENLLFNTSLLQRDQPSLISIYDIVSSDSTALFREFANFCNGGQLNRDDKTGLYFDTPAFQILTKDLIYTFFLKVEKGSHIVEAIYFSKRD